jgi:protease-4
MNNKRFGCLSVGLVVLLALSMLVNVVLIVATSTRMAGRGILPPETPKFDENVVVAGKAGLDEKIALLSLRGIITSVEPGMLGETAIDDLKLQLKQAADDAKVKAIVLSIDSPGGEVTASDVLYNAVREMREKKPVIIYMGSLSASGGYYVACGGSWLMANETTLTGSIGVIMQALNYETLFGKIGLQMHTFKSGKFKDMLSGSRPITNEEQEYIQVLIMQTYGKFVGIVAKERNLPEEQLRAGIADGRVLSGKDAFGAKLVDQLGTVEDAYAKAMELGKAAGATIVRYDAGFKLSRLFRLLGQSGKTNIEVDVAKSLTPKLEAGRLYFLPSFYAP